MSKLRASAPRRKVTFGLCFAFALSLAATGAAALSPSEVDADSSCPDAHFCTWYQADYDGIRDKYTDVYAQFGWYGLNGVDRSTKNRFGARRVKFGELTYQGVLFVRDCVKAGNNNPNLHASVNQANIGAQGTGNDC